MFDRFILASSQKRIYERFNRAEFRGADSYFQDYNIPTGRECYVITDYQTNDIQKFTFGLNLKNSIIPFVRAEGDRNKNDDPKYSGSKAIFLKPEYRNLIRQKRCLVLADAFVASIEKGSPYLVHLTDKQRPFAFGGIWDKSDEVYSFAIITVPANRLLQQLGYTRMPFILQQEFENRWLKPTTPLSVILDMMNPYPDKYMNAYPISNRITDETINEKSLVTPAGKPVYEKTPDEHKWPRGRKKAGNPYALAWGERIIHKK